MIRKSCHLVERARAPSPSRPVADIFISAWWLAAESVADHILRSIARHDQFCCGHNTTAGVVLVADLDCLWRLHGPKGWPAIPRLGGPSIRSGPHNTPEASVGRALLKKQANEDRRQFWGGKASAGSRPYSEALANVSTSLANMRERDNFLDTLQPTTELQKRLLATARELTTSMGQTRLAMSLQLDNPVPWPLLAIVVSWSLLLFCGAGLLSHVNATTLTSMAFGAFSVASAIFLILELISRIRDCSMSRPRPSSELPRISPNERARGEFVAVLAGTP